MAPAVAPFGRKLRMALAGGGGSGFIGRIHVSAATLDGRAELVAGVLSSDPGRSRAAAPAFGIPEARAYGSYLELMECESRLPGDRRVDFVSIATPNHTHFEIARAALQAGFNVVCDKPLTTSLEDALVLEHLVASTGAVFVLTYGYSGYAMVRQAREMVRRGELGQIQAFRIQYIQGGLRRLRPGETPIRGAWKSDPAKAGPAGTLADIGTHAFHLARYVTGLVPSDLACQFRTFIPGRQLDDYVHVVLRFPGGALGTLTASQVTHGRLNDLTVEVDGTTGSLVWRQESPEKLEVRRHRRPIEILEQNARDSSLFEPIQLACRLPGGHPEGFFEAFANVYRDGFGHMAARASGRAFDTADARYPTVRDGVEGVRFVQVCLGSNRSGGAWVPCSPPAEEHG
jgi:predicted dehydrogenase